MILRCSSCHEEKEESEFDFFDYMIPLCKRCNRQTLFLDLEYYIRTGYDYMNDEYYIVLKKSGIGKFHYDNYRGPKFFEPNNIKEGDIPEPPHIDRITIDLPRFYDIITVKDISYYEMNEKVINRALLHHVERQMINHLETESIIHQLDIRFKINWERVEPPKI